MEKRDDVVDKGLTNIPISFNCDTRGMKCGESRGFHIDGKDLAPLLGVSDIDMLNPRSVQVETASNMGHYALDMYHELPVTEKDKKTGEHRVVSPGIKANLASNAVHVYDMYAEKEDGSGCEKKPTLCTAHVIAHGPSFTPTEIEFLPSREQDKANVDGLHKKLSTWKEYGSDSLMAGVNEVKLDDGAAKHYCVTAKDLTTGKDSAIYTLLQRNPTTRGLLQGRYRHSNPAIHTKHKGQHAYKMTEADVKEAAQHLWAALSTHNNFQKGFGVVLTKLSNDREIPQRQSGAIMTNPHTGATKTKIVDDVTGKVVGNTHVNCVITRQPFDPVLGFIPYERNGVVTKTHLETLVGTKTNMGQPASASASGFERKL